MRGLVLALVAVCLSASAAFAAPDFTVTGLSPGQSVVSNIQVMAVPVAGTTPQNVTFTLLTAAGAAIYAPGVEYAVPYCFNGDNGQSCTPYNTATVPDGAYQLRVVMMTTAGGVSKTIPFTIANKGAPVLPPGKPSAPVLVKRDAADWPLFWNNNSATQTSVEVERAPTVGGPFAQIAILPGDKDTHIDRDVTMTGSYCWRVRAFEGTKPSSYSNVACTP